MNVTWSGLQGTPSQVGAHMATDLRICPSQPPQPNFKDTLFFPLPPSPRLLTVS